VNLAARVQNMARGGDILVSSALAEHTQGCAPLARQGWQAESLSVQAKGFDAPVPVLRFTRGR
jgi:class 3 adenylate cyclase